MARVMQQCIDEEEIGYCEIETFLADYSEACRSVSLERSSLARLEVKFQERSVVESRSVIQPIAVCVITNPQRDRVLVVQKNKKAALKNSPEHNKLLLYVGGHTRVEDSYSCQCTDLLGVCQTALEREVEEEIGLKVDVTDVTPFAIYIPESEKSKKHMAICYFLELPIDSLTLTIDEEELCVATPSGKSGHFVSVKALKRHPERLESWSREILDRCFS